MIYLLVVAAAALAIVATRFGPSLIAQIRQRRQRPNPPPNQPANPPAGPPAGPPAAGPPAPAPNPPANPPAGPPAAAPAPAPPAPAPAAPATRVAPAKGFNAWKWGAILLAAAVAIGLLVVYGFKAIAIAVLGATILVPAWFGGKKLLKDAGGKISVGIFLLVVIVAAWASWDSIARSPVATWASFEGIQEQYARFMSGLNGVGAREPLQVDLRTTRAVGISVDGNVERIAVTRTPGNRVYILPCWPRGVSAPASFMSIPEKISGREWIYIGPETPTTVESIVREDVSRGLRAAGAVLWVKLTTDPRQFNCSAPT